MGACPNRAGRQEVSPAVQEKNVDTGSRRSVRRKAQKESEPPGHLTREEALHRVQEALRKDARPVRPETPAEGGRVQARRGKTIKRKRFGKGTLDFHSLAELALTTPVGLGKDDGKLRGVEQVIVELLAATFDNLDSLLHPRGDAKKHKETMQDARRDQIEAPIPHWGRTFIACLFRDTMLEDCAVGDPLPNKFLNYARLQAHELEHLHIVMAAHLGALFAYWDHCKVTHIDAFRFTVDETTMVFSNAECNLGSKVRVRPDLLPSNGTKQNVPVVYLPQSQKPRLELLAERTLSFDAQLSDSSSNVRFPPVAPVAKRAMDAWLMLEQVVFHNTLLATLAQGPALPKSILYAGEVFDESENSDADGNGHDGRHPYHCPYARINDAEFAELRLNAESNMQSFLVEFSTSPSGKWFDFEHLHSDDED